MLNRPAPMERDSSSKLQESDNSIDTSSSNRPKSKLSNHGVVDREKPSSSVRSETEGQEERDTSLKPVKLEPEEEKSSGTDGATWGLATSKILKQLELEV